MTIDKSNASKIIFETPITLSSFNIVNKLEFSDYNLSLVAAKFEKSFDFVLVFNGTDYDKVMPYHYIRLFLSFLSNQPIILKRFQSANVKQLFLTAFQKSKMLIWLFQELYLILESREFISLFSDEKFMISKSLYKDIIDLINLLSEELDILIVFDNFDCCSDFTSDFFEQLVIDSSSFSFLGFSKKNISSENIDVRMLDVKRDKNELRLLLQNKCSSLTDNSIEAIVSSSSDLYSYYRYGFLDEILINAYINNKEFSNKSIFQFYYESYFNNNKCHEILNLLLLFEEPIQIKTIKSFFKIFDTNYYDDLNTLIKDGVVSCFGNPDNLDSFCYFSEPSILHYLNDYNRLHKVNLSEFNAKFIHFLLSENVSINVQLTYFLFRSLVKYDYEISKQQFEVVLEHLNFLISVFVNIKHNDYDSFVSTLETFYLRYDDISLSKKLLFIDFNIQYNLANNNFKKVENYIFIRKELVPNQQLNNVFFQIKYLEKQHQYKEIADLAIKELKQNKITIFTSSIPALLNFILIFLKINIRFKQKDKIVSSQLDYNYELIHKTLISLALSSIWQLFNSFEDHAKPKSVIHKLLFMKNYSFILNQASLKLLYISLRKGYSEGSVFGYNVYWLHYCSVFKFKKAFEMGRKLLPFFSTQNSEIANFSLLLYYFWVSPIKFSYDFSIIQISNIRSLSEKYSRHFSEGVSIIFLLFLKINSGVNLHLILNDFEKFRNDSFNQAYYREISLECLDLLESSTTNEFNYIEYRYLTNIHQKNIVFASPILFETLMLFINNKYLVIIPEIPVINNIILYLCCCCPGLCTIVV